jgi:hypothetical protein
MSNVNQDTQARDARTQRILEHAEEFRLAMRREFGHLPLAEYGDVTDRRREEYSAELERLINAGCFDAPESQR